MIQKRYINDVRATTAAFTSDGYYKTGDIARRKGDYYFILGRASIDSMLATAHSSFPVQDSQVRSSHQIRRLQDLSTRYRTRDPRSRLHRRNDGRRARGRRIWPKSCRCGRPQRQGTQARQHIFLLDIITNSICRACHWTSSNFAKTCAKVWLATNYRQCCE